VFAWNKPQTGWLKVNTDASFVLSTHTGTGGAVIRDEFGRMVGASANFYNHIPDVLTAEAVAARDSLLLARAGGHAKVLLEIDNLPLVNLLRSLDGERSPIAGIWHEIRELSRVFTSFDISFVNREGNEAAHRCAKLASRSSPRCVWSESFPSDLLRIAHKQPVRLTGGCC
jgi:hypothetical protein